MLILIGTALLLVGVIAAAYWSYRRASGEAEMAMASIAARARAPAALFDERMLDGLPEIAQRYFRHAIAQGTPLSRRTGWARLSAVRSCRRHCVCGKQAPC